MIISRAPLRVSLAGGGTDWPDYAREHGGLVVTGAIDKYVTVVLSSRFEPEICIVWREHLEIAERFVEIEHDIIRECLKFCEMPERHLEIHTIAELPGRGSGLGSSSALTVAMLKACHRWRDEYPSMGELAKEACHIEREVLGAPIGVQDQYIAATGGMQIIALSESVMTSPLRIGRDRLRELNDRLALYYTGVARPSNRVLASRDARSEEGLAALKQTLECARQMRAVLEDPNADLDQVGELLHESWLAKQTWTPEANTNRIEQKYRFLRSQGAIGGKLCGAGGGGFLLVYIKPEDKARIGKWVWANREMPFQFQSLTDDGGITVA